MRVQLSSVLHHSGVATALPALPTARRTAVLDAIDSLAGRLGASSPVLTLVLKFRLSLIADPQNFYPAEGAAVSFLEEQAAASWLEASPFEDATANESNQSKPRGPCTLKKCPLLHAGSADILMLCCLDSSCVFQCSVCH